MDDFDRQDLGIPITFEKALAEAVSAAREGRIVTAIVEADAAMNLQRRTFYLLDKKFGALVAQVHLEAKDRLPALRAKLEGPLSDDFRSSLIAAYGESVVSTELNHIRSEASPSGPMGRTGEPVKSDSELIVLRWAKTLRILERVIEQPRMFSPTRIRELVELEAVLRQGPKKRRWRAFIREVASIREGLEAIARDPGHFVRLVRMLALFLREPGSPSVQSAREDSLVRGLSMVAPDSFGDGDECKSLRDALDRDWDPNSAPARFPMSFFEDDSPVGTRVITGLVEGLVARLPPPDALRPAPQPAAQEGGNPWSKNDGGGWKEPLSFAVYLAGLSPRPTDKLIYPGEVRPVPVQLRLLAKDSILDWMDEPSFPKAVAERVTTWASQEAATYYSGERTAIQIRAGARRFLRAVALELAGAPENSAPLRRSAFVALVALHVIVSLVHEYLPLDERDVDAARRLDVWTKAEADLLWAARNPGATMGLPDFVARLRSMVESASRTPVESRRDAPEESPHSPRSNAPGSVPDATEGRSTAEGELIHSVEVMEADTLLVVNGARISLSKREARFLQILLLAGASGLAASELVEAVGEVAGGYIEEDALGKHRSAILGKVAVALGGPVREEFGRRLRSRNRVWYFRPVAKPGQHSSG